jgi:hypothetical protein
MTFHLSTDVGVWLAALLTLAAFSFLWRDNPVYRFAEHLFVGVSAGYFIILNYWTVIVPNLLEPLGHAMHGDGFDPRHHGFLASQMGDYRGWLLLPAALSLLLLARLLPRGGWISRWPLAVVIGVYAGIKTTGFGQSDFVAQLQASLQPLWTGDLATSLNAILFTIGLVSSLMFFFYSREQRGVIGGLSRLGLVFLMVGFGAGYGYTVMSRISLLIGRFQFLLENWLGLR